MITIAIVNQKGGVGKTTTAVTLGHGLAQQGNCTLLVDLDAQGNIADALGLEKWCGLYHLLMQGTGVDAARQTGREHLDAILGDKRTVEAKQVLAGRPFREQALKRALRPFANWYDVCILDVAPGVDVLQIGALVAADFFLVPVALDHLAVVGAGDALASAMSLKEMDALTGRFLGILPTFWERTTNESHEQLALLTQQFERWVWPPIPLDVKAREAPAHGKTLWEYAPSTRALAGVEIAGAMVGGYRQVLMRLIEEVF